ncbi:hypothetical protein JRG19_01340 [Pseudoclavibacter alba]|uniref:hypothetical protein n=1 Tax=Pseudoclavibacter albus TaxID=272241 RepID=UPI0019D08D0A|nr:hypothetical protein [Pseudoclavibacter alba]MBN6777194.1 hypothetical protein [Pseudoclavibacter alba]
MQMYGANTDDLRDVASMFGNTGRLAEDAQVITGRVMGDLLWIGKDADTFREMYAEPIPRHLAQLAIELEDRGRDLFYQANEQDDASAAKGLSSFGAIAMAALGASFATGVEGTLGSLALGIGGPLVGRAAMEMAKDNARERAFELAMGAFALDGFDGIATLAKILGAYALLFGPASLIGRGALALLAALADLMHSPEPNTERLEKPKAPKHLEFIEPEKYPDNYPFEPKEERQSSGGGANSGGGGAVPSDWKGGSASTGEAAKLPAPGAGLMTQLASGGMGGSGRALGDGVSAFGGSVAGSGQQMPPLLLAIGALGLAGAAAATGVTAAKAFKRNKPATSAR